MYTGSGFSLVSLFFVNGIFGGKPCVDFFASVEREWEKKSEICNYSDITGIKKAT